jgi:hypothetical protein
MMKKITLTKKIFGILILILVGSLGFYLMHHENRKVANPIENKQFNNDSSMNRSTDVTPTEMGVKPEKDIKDGSVKIVKEFVKLNVKNPSTYEFFEWSEISSEDGYWKVRCKYKGVSSFNAEVTTNAWFYIQNNKVVYTEVISKI